MKFKNHRLCWSQHYRVLVGVIGVLLSLMVNSGYSLAEDGRASPAQPEVILKWLPPCSTNITEPYFSIEVFADGAVRYVGGEQAREVGGRKIKIDKHWAQQLIRVARGTASGSTRVIFDDYDHRYCLEIEKSKGKKLVAKGAAGERRMQDVINKFSELAADNKWVCPARSPGKDWNYALNYSGYCGGYLERPAISFTLFDENSCSGLGGRVYEDVIYYSFLRRSKGKIQPASGDGYRVITRADFMSLIEASKKFQLAKLGIEEPNARIDQDYSSNNSFASPSERFQRDLTRLKKSLVEIFQSAYPQPILTPDCQGDTLSGGLTLRYEYGPPVKE